MLRLGLCVFPANIKEELLRSYRVAHSRVLTIEPFEASLRENTPLTSISDPKALVEYLNQINLKGDMVLGELKRVSNERDNYKQKLGESEKITKEAWDNLRSSNDPKAAFHGSDDKSDISPSENEHATHESSNGDPLRVIEKSSPTSISPTILTTGVSLFSPKQKPTTPRSRPGSVDLFSYDSEIPRLETELHERQCKIDSLEREMKSLKGDLAVARESTQSMVQTLEEATRELNTLRDSKDRSAADMKQQRILSDKLSETLRAELLSSEKNLQELQACHGSQCSDRINELDTQLQAARQELESVQSEAKRNTSDTHQVEDFQSTVVNFEKEILEMRADKKQSEKKIDTLNNLVVTLRSQLTEIVEQKSQESAYLNAKIEKLQLTPKKATQSSPNAQAEGNSEEMSTQGSQSTRNEPMANQGTSNASKKKNKKKRKGNSSLEQHKEIQPEPGRAPQTSEKGIDEAVRSGTVIKLEEELRQLRILLEEKDAAIERIHGKLKDQEGLREEIDTLRDDLVNVGQEHVESKDRVKELVSEKTTLESTVANLEGELAELRSFHASITAGSEQKHKDLEVQLEDLKIKANALQIDLSAAQHLASSRFKDLKDLRNVLQKVQPEINTLRSEAAEMKGVKEALEKKDAEFKRLDSKHEEMRSEVARLKQIVTDREFENRALNQKMNQEISSRLKAEDAVSNSVQEIQRLEIERRQATESLDRMSRDLAKAREELIASKIRLRELDQQLSKSGCDNEALKEEIDLKTAQYASAQSLMASMRDQTAEMAMQTKEARERCEGLDEEVADAHRLLSERSREGETMRRLLADVEGRADARTREMKERMDIAIEERDRAEEEASTAGRRRARDLEDLKTKYRDIEISLKRAEEDKEELITAQRDWKRGREELEDRAGQSTKEVYEVRKAMDELRDALDERERQAWELEKEKAELRRSVEETQHRLEKLQKSNKVYMKNLSDAVINVY